MANEIRSFNSIMMALRHLVVQVFPILFFIRFLSLQLILTGILEKSLLACGICWRAVMSSLRWRGMRVRSLLLHSHPMAQRSHPEQQLMMGRSSCGMWQRKQISPYLRHRNIEVGYFQCRFHPKVQHSPPILMARSRCGR